MGTLSPGRKRMVRPLFILIYLHCWYRSIYLAIYSLIQLMDHWAYGHGASSWPALACFLARMMAGIIKCFLFDRKANGNPSFLSRTNQLSCCQFKSRGQMQTGRRIHNNGCPQDVAKVIYNVSNNFTVWNRVSLSGFLSFLFADYGNS